MSSIVSVKHIVACSEFSPKHRNLISDSFGNISWNRFRHPTGGSLVRPNLVSLGEDLESAVSVLPFHVYVFR